MSEEDPHPEIQLSSQLLRVVRDLAIELTPERASMQITLDSNLDRELGFDSLSRVELLLRLERELNVRLPEQAFSTAETPRDLLLAARTASPHQPAGHDRAEPINIVMGATDKVPQGIDTLQDVLSWRAKREPDRTHVLLYEADSETPTPVSFAALESQAKVLASGLVRRGLEPGQAVSIMLPTSRSYLESFFGVLYAGGIPVPIYPPARPSQLEDHLKRHGNILTNAGARFLITVPEGRTVGRLLKHQVEGLLDVVTPEDLEEDGGSYQPVTPHPDDTALLQYTSGSTGQPKGVILSHANLLANIRAMGEWVNAGSDDVFVSWLPLYHDMGLIGAWLGSLYFAMLAVLMPPTAFLVRPPRWFQTIHKHRGTISAAPNFAYQLALARIDDADLEGLDLSSLRLLFNGAEPISPRTLRSFGERFSRYGLAPEAVSPVYGLAEAAVGLAFPPLGRGPLIDRVQRNPFERAGRAVPAGPEDPALEFVACGRPLMGYEIRIVDDGGRELGDAEVGHLQFRGPSATRGYMNNPEATAKLFDVDWLDSGDLAYIREGDVYLTSRVKDVIIRAGRNIYPYELEEAVGDLTEVRKGCVAVFGSRADDELERLIVVAETRLQDPDQHAAIERKIESLAADVCGVNPDDVVIAPPGTVLKTSSGKIRRTACRELYESGRIGSGPGATWRQMVRLWLAGLGNQTRRVARRASAIGYVAWAYLMAGLVLGPAVLAAMVLPEGKSRWHALNRLAGLYLRVARIPVLVQGLENLPADGRCVIVANHASYLDGLLLLACLPEPVAFVAKGELRQKRFARWCLGRIGVQFVERFDPDQGSRDAARLAERAAAGIPLLYFPEGTFTRYPGLLAFHMGAFLSAATNDLPVVPVGIRGTRSVLRSDDWFPRRGPVAVIIDAPLPPAGDDWESVLELRNRARAAVLRHTGEQDLALERGLP
jgi:1-acyl-sn-glycerol-3-phosphate acyltransferase